VSSAIVVGSGPNGLACAAALATEGVEVTVLEAEDTIGGGTRTSELTLPGVLHDECSAVHPMASGSPFFKALELERHGLKFVRPDPTLVQPLDGDRLYVGWRDPKPNHAQLETYAPGEAARYDAFFAYLQTFADRLGISIVALEA